MDALTPAPGNAAPGMPRALWRGLRKLGWAVADQGAAAAATFLLGLLLARWLPAEAYGAYALTLAFLTLGVAIHTALISEPLLVFAGTRYSGRAASYHRVLGKSHRSATAILMAAAAAASLAAWLAKRPDLAVPLAGAAAVLPFTLWAWFLRRTCYAHLQVRPAALASLAGLAVAVLGATALRLTGRLTLATAYAMAALAALVPTLLLRRHLGRRLPAGPEVDPRDVRQAHGAYGRWSLLASGFGWVPTSLPVIVLPWFAGLAANGSLRAAANLATPMLQLNATVGMLLLPALARSDPARRAARTAQALLAVAGASLLFWAAAALLAPVGLRVLYGGRYPDAAGLVAVLALLPATEGVVYLVGTSLRAGGAIREVALANLAAAAVSALLVLALVPRAGAMGAAGSMVLGSAATGAAQAFFWARRSRRRAAEAST